MCLKEIKKCLYCDGFRYVCKQYTPRKDELCVWYAHMDRNLEWILELIKDEEATILKN
jgi:hypothetical protein